MKGRVQGVGYRYFTLLAARNLGLTGFVKNLPDRSVYIRAQGSPESVGQLIDLCRTGPPRAVVEYVEFESCPAAEFPGFQIR